MRRRTNLSPITIAVLVLFLLVNVGLAILMATSVQDGSTTTVEATVTDVERRSGTRFSSGQWYVDVRFDHHGEAYDIAVPSGARRPQYEARDRVPVTFNDGAIRPTARIADSGSRTSDQLAWFLPMLASIGMVIALVAWVSRTKRQSPLQAATPAPLQPEPPHLRGPVDHHE